MSTMFETHQAKYPQPGDCTQRDQIHSATLRLRWKAQSECGPKHQVSVNSVLVIEDIETNKGESLVESATADECKFS